MVKNQVRGDTQTRQPQKRRKGSTNALGLNASSRHVGAGRRIVNQRTRTSVLDRIKSTNDISCTAQSRTDRPEDTAHAGKGNVRTGIYYRACSAVTRIGACTVI